MCSFGPSDLIGNDFRVAVFPFETQSESLLVIYERRVFHLLQRVAQVLRSSLLHFSVNLLLRGVCELGTLISERVNLSE